MFRELRTEVKGTLVAVEPLLVAGEALPGTDAAPLRDGAGRYLIPGSSLAGVLRHAALALGFDESVVRDLFGTHDVETHGASRVVVRDALAVGPVRANIRDLVGIDRRSGAAAENIKFDRVALAAGTQFEFSVRLDSRRESELRGHLETLLSLLVDGGIRVGSGGTRGQGCIILRDALVRHTDLADARAVVDLMRQPDAGWGRFQHTVPSLDRLTVEFDWEPCSALLSAVGVDDGAVDHAPLVEVDGSDPRTLRMVLPGTSIKGAMRSRVDYIMRTIQGVDAPTLHEEQMIDSPAELLFGSTRHRSMIAVDDATADVLVAEDPMTTWNDLLSDGTDSTNRTVKLRADLAKARGGAKGRLVPATHVAVDRWTGGPVDGALYSVLEPHGFDWTPLRVHVDTRALVKNGNSGAALAMLTLCFDDLMTGRVPLGFGTYRGLGSIRINGVRATYTGDDPSIRAFCGAIESAPCENGLLETLDDGLRNVLAAGLRSALDAWEPSQGGRR